MTTKHCELPMPLKIPEMTEPSIDTWLIFAHLSFSQCKLLASIISLLTLYSSKKYHHAASSRRNLETRGVGKKGHQNVEKSGKAVLERHINTYRIYTPFLIAVFTSKMHIPLTIHC